MSTTLCPYLNFNGNTRQAMEFYRDVLGGKLALQTFAEAPNMPLPPGYQDKVMHARLDADGFVIMAAEGEPGKDVNFGNNVSLMLSGTDEARLTKVFNALSQGGTVRMPLAKQFWGDTFGLLTDKFGVHWMVNITHA